MYLILFSTTLINCKPKFCDSELIVTFVVAFASVFSTDENVNELTITAITKKVLMKCFI